ncbi:hypothetical protein DYB35_005305 [Aphanomyces astaci]|uniref:EF-hand domain-containing protein n=1 Tax=Aphanomyces astaci TaxID=112090 RepID=A0A418DKK4_APHAT|nr:hypothetical protein DYB35_005305 [Aphanomyces astaci]
MSRRAAASAAAWRSRDADVDEAVVTPASSTSRLDISRVCRVAISRHGTVRDLLLHPDMPLEELYGCLRAIFPHVNTTPIALKNEANTLFPLSLLAHHPSTFSRAKKEAAHVSFELVCLGDPDVSYSELTRPVRVGWHAHGPHELTQFTLPQLIRAFRALDRSTFHKTLPSLVPSSSSSAPDDENGHALLSRVFDVFDKERTGVVDVVEFVSGLSVLVPGDRDDKIQATFSLYDHATPGFIGRDDMTTYLTSVYLVVAELNPDVFATNHVDPIQLGHVTAAQCFEDADVNHDGRLSYAEFQTWYSKTHLHNHQPHARKLKKQQHDISQRHQPLQVKWTLSAVRDLTGLGDYAVDEMLLWFPNSMSVTEADFLATMQRILQRQRKPVTVQTSALLRTLFGLYTAATPPTTALPTPPPLFPGHIRLAHQHQLPSKGPIARSSNSTALERVGVLTNLSWRHPLDVVDQLFRAFDGDGDGVVDFCELSSGLSLLCAGSQEEKIHAAFTLYDVNKDSFISHPELVSYLTAVFRVIYAFGSDLPLLPPMELADATAADAFARFDSNHDGQLSLAEFTAWYQTTTPTPNLSHATQPFDLACLRDVRRVTRLGQYAVADIFSFFQASATDGANNHLTKAQFFRCFNKLLSKVDEDTSRPPPQQLKATLDQLFIVFDSDGNGVVDTKELAAGLSLLCGGTHQDKVQAAFSLYDTNGDGFISRDEMVAYLTSVFKVLLQTSPALQAQLHHVAPSQLAVATTSQAFATCDVNHDDKLSIEEFTAWYQQQQHQIPSKQQQSDQVSSKQEPPLSQTRTRELLGKRRNLGHLTVDALVDLCRDRLSARVTSEKEFTALFAKLLQHSNNEAKKAKTTTALLQHRLFASLTSAFASFVPGLTYQDVACGLSVLTNDHNKVRATFSLMDRDGDLALSADELLRYFTAVFAVIWYTQDDKNAILPESALPLSLQQVRHITALGYLDVDDAFEHLADCADDAVDSGGRVTLDAFAVCLTNLAAEFHGHVPPLLASVATALFRAFDQDRVEFAELAAGLSVLCKGTRQAKVQAAFSLYDYNSDGYISMDEMTRYLTAVFRVLYVLHPNMAADTGVSAVELGQLTADEAFAFQPDSPPRRRLSLAEFAAWFAKHEPNPCASLPDIKVAPKREVPWTLDAVRRHTKLMFHRPQVVFELFAQAAHDDGHLDQAGFDKCFRYLMGNCTDQSKHDMSTCADQSQDDTTETQFLRRLFALFDSNEDGSKEDKVQAAFVLFDLNGDGSISLEEMTQYLTSVFRVLFELSDQPRQLNGVSPVELATVTAAQAFHHVDLNPDGRIRLDEFKRNSMRLVRVAARRVTQLERHAPDVVLELLADCADASGVLTKLAFTECFQVHFLSSGADDTRALAVVHRLFDIFDTDGNGTVDYAELTAGLSLLYTQSNKPIKSSALSIPLPSLAQVHHVTDLGTCSPADVIERFRQFATANQLTRAAFSIGLQSFAKPAHKEAVDAIASHVFDLFDTDGNGVVDIVELGAGLCVLCGGSQEDKVRAAFALYDLNHTISRSEMALYLSSVFKVLFHINPETHRQMQGAGITPEELGTITADQAFIHAEKESDGALSLDEFRRWYQSTASQIIQVPSLQRVKEVTNLHKFSPSQVFAHLTTYATTITTDIVDDQMCDVVLDRLFRVFDANGFVSFRELASGLSILCGGSPTDKIQAVFDLYDANCDGVISLDEMTAYLTSVYKILCETDMYPKHVTPSELAEVHG